MTTKTVRRLPQFLGFMFLLMGIPCLLGSLYFAADSYRLVKEGDRAEGRVVELAQRRGSKSGWVYAPVFRFETAGGKAHVIQSSSASNPPSYEVGDRVMVLYPPGKPNDAIIQGFFELWGAALIIGSVGGVIGGIGIYLILSFIRKQQLQRWLKEHGRRIPTDIQSVEENRSIKVNGRSPFRIVSTWKDPATQTFHYFRSEDFWENPTPALEGRKTIDVLIDVSDPKKHWMDTSFLPS
jgi:hypothetical protein